MISCSDILMDQIYSLIKLPKICGRSGRLLVLVCLCANNDGILPIGQQILVSEKIASKTKMPDYLWPGIKQSRDPQAWEPRLLSFRTVCVFIIS